jgi:hypothetical protein
MPDKKNLKIAGAIAGICIVAAVIAYASTSAVRVEEPVRVYFNVTGHDNVLFQHMVHVTDYGSSCTDCHHEFAGKVGKMDASCGTCHEPGVLRVPAFGEGGLFDHDIHSYDYGLSCTDCHHEMNDFGMDPQRCSDCHFGEEMARVAHDSCVACHTSMSGPIEQDCNSCHGPRGRTDAFHDQCIGCHENVNKGPVEADCESCHGF